MRLTASGLAKPLLHRRTQLPTLPPHHTHPPLHRLRPALPPLQDPAFQRHLLRLWLAPPEERPLPPAYSEIMPQGGYDLVPGNRGGIVTSDTKLHVPLDPEQ